jgi:hypothetical protein
MLNNDGLKYVADNNFPLDTPHILNYMRKQLYDSYGYLHPYQDITDYNKEVFKGRKEVRLYKEFHNGPVLEIASPNLAERFWRTQMKLQLYQKIAKFRYDKKKTGEYLSERLEQMDKIVKTLEKGSRKRLPKIEGTTKLHEKAENRVKSSTVLNQFHLFDEPRGPMKANLALDLSPYLNNRNIFPNTFFFPIKRKYVKADLENASNNIDSVLFGKENRTRTRLLAIHSLEKWAIDPIAEEIINNPQFNLKKYVLDDKEKYDKKMATYAEKYLYGAMQIRNSALNNKYYLHYKPWSERKAELAARHASFRSGEYNDYFPIEPENSLISEKRLRFKDSPGKQELNNLIAESKRSFIPNKGIRFAKQYVRPYIDTYHDLRHGKPWRGPVRYIAKRHMNTGKLVLYPKNVQDVPAYKLMPISARYDAVDVLSGCKSWHPRRTFRLKKRDLFFCDSQIADRVISNQEQVLFL